MTQAEKALIIDDSWSDDDGPNKPVLVRVDPVDRVVFFLCMPNLEKSVILTFEELEAVQALVQEVQQEEKEANDNP